MGIYSTYPLLDNRIYEIQFPDWALVSYTIHVLNGNLFPMGVYRNNTDFLEAIIYHCKIQYVVYKWFTWITMSNGTKIHIIKTKMWGCYIYWRKGSPSWYTLKDINDINHLEAVQCTTKSGNYKWTCIHLVGILYHTETRMHIINDIIEKSIDKYN